LQVLKDKAKVSVRATVELNWLSELGLPRFRLYLLATAKILCFNLIFGARSYHPHEVGLVPFFRVPTWLAFRAGGASSED
jgi:hypothetical protein